MYEKRFWQISCGLLHRISKWNCYTNSLKSVSQLHRRSGVFLKPNIRVNHFFRRNFNAISYIKWRWFQFFGDLFWSDSFLQGFFIQLNADSRFWSFCSIFKRFLSWNWSLCLFFEKMMEKAFVRKVFLYYGVSNLCSSFLKGVQLYNEGDKCCPLFYSLP